MSSLEELMSEMAALSGIEPERRRTLRNPESRLRALLEGDGGMAARENMKGRVEILAKRLEGVIDFIEDGDMQSATVAFSKILKDAEKTLEEMGVAYQRDAKEKKKEADADKEAEKELKQQQKQQGGAPDQGPQQSPKGTPAQSPPKVSRESLRDAVIVSGEVITDLSDPFGRGEEFKRFIAEASGIPKK